MADGDGRGKVDGDGRGKGAASDSDAEEGLRPAAAEEASIAQEHGEEVIEVIAQEPAEDDKLDDYLLSRLETVDNTQKLRASETREVIVQNTQEDMLESHKNQTEKDDSQVHLTDIPRQYFEDHLLPLRQSALVEGRQWLRDRFEHLSQIVDMVIPLPSLAESPEKTRTEIKDYLFLYFPELRPPIEPIRGQQQSPLWRFGEKVWVDGKRSFRCFSCHKVFQGSGAGRLRAHLEGGSTHQSRCPAVLPCTLASLDLIPRA